MLLKFDHLSKGLDLPSRLLEIQNWVNLPASAKRDIRAAVTKLRRQDAELKALKEKP